MMSGSRAPQAPLHGKGGGDGGADEPAIHTKDLQLCQQ